MRKRRKADKVARLLRAADHDPAKRWTVARARMVRAPPHDPEFGVGAMA